MLFLHLIKHSEQHIDNLIQRDSIERSEEINIWK